MLWFIYIYNIYIYSISCFYLQDGVKETGVSIAYTVCQLDAGPVIARERVGIDDQVKVMVLLLCFSILCRYRYLNHTKTLSKSLETWAHLI